MHDITPNQQRFSVAHHREHCMPDFMTRRVHRRDAAPNSVAVANAGDPPAVSRQPLYPFEPPNLVLRNQETLQIWKCVRAIGSHESADMVNVRVGEGNGPNVRLCDPGFGKTPKQKAHRWVPRIGGTRINQNVLVFIDDEECVDR